MSRIDGSTGTVHRTEIQQIKDQEELRSRAAEHAQVPADADALAYLKLSGATPVPAFAGAADPADTAGGKQALSVIDNYIGVDYTAIMKLAVQLSSEERRSSSEATIMDIEAVAAQQKIAASDIRAGAGLALAAGIVSSSINIGAGMVAIGGGAKGMSVASEANSPGVANTNLEELAPSEKSGTTESEPSAPTEDMVKSAAPGEPGTTNTEGIQSSSNETTQGMETTEEDITESEAKKQQARTDEVADFKKSMTSFAREGRMFMLSQRAHSISTLFQGVSSSMQGTGQAVGSLGKFASDMYQAKSKEDEAEAAKMQAALEKERDYGKSVADDTKKMMDVISQIDQSKHDTQTKIFA